MKRWIQTLLIGAAVVAPVAGFAAIDGTHHDMTNVLATEGNTEKCAFCHSVLLPSMDLTGTNYGSVGNFCVVVCHQANGLPATSNAMVEPQGPDTFTGDNSAGDGTSFGYVGKTLNASVLDLTLNHAADPTVLDTIGDGGATNDGATLVSNTGWPHSSEGSMQCTTCHTVHDNTNAPFLNAPLSTGTASTSFCARCHTGEGFADAGEAGRFTTLGTPGAHPVEMAFNAATAGRSLWTAGPVPTNMTEVVSGTGDLDVDGDSWVTGGHLIDGTTGLPTTNVSGRVGCYSCHSPHQDQGAAPTASLILGNSYTNFCYACHGGGMETVAGTGSSTQENPGTTREYHPVNTEAPSAAMPGMAASLSADYTGAGALIYAGAGNSPYCYSCHDVHGGRAGEMATRTLGATKEDNFCEECHGLITGHHPSNTTTDYTATADGGYANPPWAVGTVDGDPGNLADGLQCNDCHGANTTAHNW